MRLIEEWECESCGSRYQTEEECRECEESHIGIDSITKVSYSPKATGESAVPKEITVQLTTGANIVYWRYQ